MIKQIALLTDFGSTDPYVGIMKGVISQFSPDLKTVDLSHQLPPGDIQAGAFHLWQSAKYFPPGTVFLAVIDPGVGSQRKGLFFQREGQIFIGPDNGLFTYLGYRAETTAWELSNPELQLPKHSNTFHGRDIFAPAAAQAALGTPGKSFGAQVDALVELPRPALTVTESVLKCEIIHIDHFGNLITSLGQFQEGGENLELSSWIDDLSLIIPQTPTLTLNHAQSPLPLVSTYSAIPDGGCAALIGSSGLLEIAANQTSAAELLGLKRGDPVTFIWNSAQPSC